MTSTSFPSSHHTQPEASTSQVSERTVQDVRPPSYSAGASTNVSQSALTSPYIIGSQSCEALPVYEETTTTEPPTLARSLWRWGFLCPFIWILGMFILCSPLRPLDEEEDPASKHKVDEMIAILRQAELKYARRCAISFGSFVMFVILVVVVVVVAIKML